jgi:hypothetical protein
MMTIFNSFVRIATLLDLRYKYLGPHMATDNRIVKIQQSLGQLETQMKFLGKEVVGEIKGLRENLEEKAK